MIKKMFLCFLCLSLFLSIPACKKKAPETPDVPAIIDPTAQSITVTSTSDMFHIGTSETFMAMVTMSDGAIKAVVGGVWGTDNPSVATVVPATGQVTIVGSGMVSIFVDYEGRRGSKSIRGLPNYQGTWSGTYRITSCIATGDFDLAGFCDVFTIGTVLIVELNLIQDDDRVEGRFLLGELGADTNGPVSTDGQLVLSGTISGGTTMIEVAMLLQSTTPGQISGRLNQIWRDTSVPGDLRLESDIQELNRISTMAMALSAGRQLLNPTLQDLIRALLRR